MFKLKEIQREFFTFTKKRWKVKIAFSVSFAGDFVEKAGHPGQRGWHRPAPFPGNTHTHTASQHQATTASNCVREHLCFSSVHFGHPLARCTLRYQKSLREVILCVWECSKNVPYKLMVITS